MFPFCVRYIYRIYTLSNDVRCEKNIAICLPGGCHELLCCCRSHRLSLFYLVQAVVRPPPPLPPLSSYPPVVFQFPQRPNHGTEGGPITLRANHFHVLMPRGVIHHYDITIMPDRCPRWVNRYGAAVFCWLFLGACHVSAVLLPIDSHYQFSEWINSSRKNIKRKLF